MTGFVDRFGGAALQPAQAAFRAVALSADVTLVWPPYATSNTDYVAGIMDVTPSTTGLSIEMPDATLVSTGITVIYRNLGSATFSVKDAAGGAIATPAAGEVRYLYLTDNTTAAGVWVSILFGVGASSPDASQLAGYGLKALASAIVFAPVTVTLNVDYQVLTTDRAKVFVWTGGSGTITLPTLVDVTPDFEVGFRNEGTGTLTVTTGDGSQIDAGSSIDLQVDESCYTHSGPTAWYTVGRGRNTQFNFTKLTKSVTGGTDTLTLTEAANVVQVYTGALASSETVVVPAVVQVYYIINDTSGAHTFTVESPIIGGTTVSVDQGEAAILFCDGTNIINCTTSGAVAINATIPAGAVGAPSLKFAPDPTTGLYQPTTGQIALAISGIRRFLLTATGLNATAIGATTPAAGSFTTLAASVSAAFPAGATVGGYPLTLAATVDIYVNGTTGNDSTGTGTALLPFATIGKAVEVASFYHLQQYGVHIHCADFNYGEDINISFGGAAALSDYALRITGNTVTPANCLTNFIYCYNAPNVLIEGFTTAAAITAESSIVLVNDCHAGAPIRAINQSHVKLGANITLVGNHASALYAETSAFLEVNDVLTLSGTPAYSTAFVIANLGAVVSFNAQPTGAATGKRYEADNNGVVNTFGGGATWLPGNAGGTTSNGGQYV